MTPRMNTHKNASLTPKGRAHPVCEIARIGLTPAAEAAGISARTARKWQRRFAAAGAAGLLDHSSRPKRSPRRSDALKVERATSQRRAGRHCMWPLMTIRTKPYTPHTNGKAERFIQTLLREWAYAYCYPTSEHRADELAPWMHHYNFHRPHSATEHLPPATRLGVEGNNVLRNYT